MYTIGQDIQFERRNRFRAGYCLWGEICFS